MAKRHYSHAHQKMRRDLDPLVQAGGIDCWRCGEEIQPGTPWDLGHDDLDKDQYRGPEHQRCNRAVKGREPNAPASMWFAPRGRTLSQCAFCSKPFTSRRRGVKYCGKLCGDRACKRAVWIAGTPRPCTDCATTILAPRVKCDDCLAETARLARRRQRQKYRKSEAGRRQRREYERRRAQRKREGGGRVVDTRAA